MEQDYKKAQTGEITPDKQNQESDSDECISDQKSSKKSSTWTATITNSDKMSVQSRYRINWYNLKFKLYIKFLNLFFKEIQEIEPVINQMTI